MSTLVQRGQKFIALPSYTGNSSNNMGTLTVHTFFTFISPA
jgi:hypothetical protein